MLSIQFKNPFTRTQLRTNLTSVVAAFPALSFSVRSAALGESLNATLDSEQNLIIGLTVDGFTTIQEVGDLLSALPAGINGRVQEIAFQ